MYHFQRGPRRKGALLFACLDRLFFILYLVNNWTAEFCFSRLANESVDKKPVAVSENLVSCLPRQHFCALIRGWDKLTLFWDTWWDAPSLLEVISRQKWNFCCHPHVGPNLRLLLWATKADVRDWQCYFFVFIASIPDNESQWCLPLSFFLNDDSIIFTRPRLWAYFLSVSTFQTYIVGLCAYLGNVVPLAVYSQSCPLCLVSLSLLDCGKPLSPAFVMKVSPLNVYEESVVPTKWAVWTKHYFRIRCCLWRWMCWDWGQSQVMDQPQGD